MTIPLAPLLQKFFVDRLSQQQQVSPNTISTYRDTFRLLLEFVSAEVGTAPTRLKIEDLSARLIGAFLNHLESARGNTARSRNTRLAGIRSFFKYVSFSEPSLLFQCQQVISMPNKKFERREVEFLSSDEAMQILSAPDRSAHLGRRDHALLLLALRTGLRASELTGLRRCDVVTGGQDGAYVRCLGKGRNRRRTPISADTVKVLKAWMAESGGNDDAPLFPATNTGYKLSRDALGRIVQKYSAAAAEKSPSLAAKRVSPHVFRHTTAMDLLQHDVHPTTISLILGHESSKSTDVYMHADMKLKERALASVSTPTTPSARYKADDDLIAFLKRL
jgi:site-specific recombinase XerD